MDRGEVKAMRYFDPLVAGHPAIGDEENRCPVCREMFCVGDVVGLLPVQKHGEDGPEDRIVLCVLVHKRCYEPGIECSREEAFLSHRWYNVE